CALAGARLCTGEEWALACGGPAGDPFPYGAAFDEDACNGGGHDAEPGRPGDQDAVLACGSLATCARAGVFDLSGNLKEWTSDTRDRLRVVRGGSYETNVAAGLACAQENDLKDPTLRHPGIGFRCCR
ncbi:MAG: SUMF1/EgtB/PvdO family nonheme iron enzyme, partial [Myxococcales bacterium]|nr:SUMF1/EgtB/PvdO family nonheme iron enzyme [Myxococcales bacterium]